MSLLSFYKQHAARQEIRNFDFQSIIKNFAQGMKRIIAISLLLIFISGQLNLTWASHYCMGFNVKNSLMLGQGQLDCGMGDMMNCRDNATDCDEENLKLPSCCSNDYVSSDSDDHFDRSESISNSQIFFIASYAETLLSFNPQNDEEISYIASPPSLMQPDLQVLYQSFLL